MNIVAIILTVMVIEIVLAILLGRGLASRSDPPPRPKVFPTESSIQPHYPDSASYKRGA